MTAIGVRHLLFAGLIAAFTLSGKVAWAHCDGLDGPVVSAARKALESGDVKRVLIWVRVDDENKIRAAFQESLKVRKLGGDAQALADRYFFETLVRIHRAGEGATYTGLKPVGRNLGPAIPAADEAIRTGSIEALTSLLTGQFRKRIDAKFKSLLAKRKFSLHDVSSGRKYVKEYVSFIHYVEKIYEAIEQPSKGHYPERH